MKVIIEESGGRTHRIVIPTGLILNRATALMLPGMLEVRGVALTKEQCIRLVKAVRACRKSHPGWKLVEVHSQDGSGVEISL